MIGRAQISCGYDCSDTTNDNRSIRGHAGTDGISAFVDGNAAALQMRHLPAARLAARDARPVHDRYQRRQQEHLTGEGGKLFDRLRRDAAGAVKNEILTELFPLGLQQSDHLPAAALPVLRWCSCEVLHGLPDARPGRGLHRGVPAAGVVDQRWRAPGAAARSATPEHRCRQFPRLRFQRVVPHASSRRDLSRDAGRNRADAVRGSRRAAIRNRSRCQQKQHVTFVNVSRLGGHAFDAIERSIRQYGK